MGPWRRSDFAGRSTARHRRRERRNAIVAPTLIQTGYGERSGQRPRALDIEAPLGTVVGGGQKHALVAAFLAKHYGGVVGHPVDDRPLGTITAWDHHSLVAASLTKFYSTNKDGAPIDESMPTITASAGGGHLGVVAASLVSHYGNSDAADVEKPLIYRRRYGPFSSRRSFPREVLRERSARRPSR
jgi:DNA (cytosine-5)-methyltransferase 1